MQVNAPSLPPLSREQVDRVVQTLRSLYPGWESFDDPRFVEDEILYKKKVIAEAANLLSASELRRLLAESQFEEILKRLEHIGKTNLLYLRVRMSGDLGILYQPNPDKAGFFAALVDLLHGEGESSDRLGRYLAWVEGAGLLNKWTFPTYFLYMCHPETEIFIKPVVTARFLGMLGFQEKLEGPSSAWYATIRNLAHELRKALADRRAKDMVDIQSAIFIAGQEENLPAPFPPPPPPFESLRASLRSKGLYFPSEVISNYLLALQTKRFVIITGISGTGKTQLALEVARYFQPKVRTAKTVDIPDGAREVTVAPYMIKYNRIVLPAAFVGILALPIPEPETYKSSIEVVYPEGRVRLSLWRSADRGVVILLFKGELRTWFRRSLKVGDKIYLAAEDPEDGFSTIHLGIPRTIIEEAAIENYVVEAVRPDWTDHRGLLGYFNPLLERYVSTRFLDLVLRAREDEGRAQEENRSPYPFFAILDEMNLARVEHYFSDFLSALESGEPLRLHDEQSVESGETEDAVPIPRSLKVPKNLFFTGTVNVDESTYMFSPKVLDRAFTLELNEVDLDGLSNIGNHEDGGPGLHLDRFPERLVFEGSPDSKHWDHLGEKPKQIVKELNVLLAQENRHFGYRVATEISRFVTLAAEQGNGEEAQRAALDLALLQKVLPKLHGTQQELEDLLKKLVHFGSGAALPRFTAKVERMLRRLERQGFTSFIE